MKREVRKQPYEDNYVLYVDATFAGSVKCWNVVDNGLYIYSLSMVPAYRGHGHGAWLVRWCIKLARQRKKHHVCLFAYAGNRWYHSRLIKWYERLGFRQTTLPPGVYSSIPSGQYMVKQLRRTT